MRSSTLAKRSLENIFLGSDLCLQHAFFVRPISSLIHNPRERPEVFLTCKKPHNATDTQSDRRNVVKCHSFSNVVQNQNFSNVVKDQSFSNVAKYRNSSNVAKDQSLSNVVKYQSFSNVAKKQNSSNVVKDQNSSNVAKDQNSSNVVKRQIFRNAVKCQSADSKAPRRGIFGGNSAVFPGFRNTSGVRRAADVRSYYTYSHEPFHPLKREPKWQSADEAVAVVKSGDTVFIHGAAATPLLLVEALTRHGLSGGLRDVTVCHIHTEGDAVYTRPECEGIFRSSSFFIGANCRKAINEGRGDYTPIFLSDIPLLFHRNIITIDVALVQVSPPDKHGFCSLGTSVDCARAAIQNAKYIIGQVNPCMPRTFGDGVVHKSHFDAMVDGLAPLPEHVPKQRSPVEDTIGTLIADNLVVDGATLQMGIGNIPDAVLACLKGHKDLGIHSEMFSDGVVDLVEAGCVTNTFKDMHPGKITGSFLVGTRRLFDFVDNNPFVVMCDVSFVNSVPIIAQNPKVTAINSCIEIDLTGQVVSDSIGTKLYSGVGGQMDFIRGAAVCRDGLGKPILAMPSTTNRGESKIVPFLKQGGGVVTSRAHVHYVITEHGIAYLFGKNLRQRAHELISIAHPDHREGLEKAAFERLHCMPSP